MGPRGGKTRGTVAFEKAPQNFCEKGYGFRLCKSGCSPIWFRPGHQEIVRERLPEGSAHYGERLRAFVGIWVLFGLLTVFSCGNLSG